MLTLATLLFSLPASNAKLERVFSQVNVIKTNKRTLLLNDTLDDLLLVTSQNIPVEEFCADSAIELWWRSKLRRPDQRPRKAYSKHRVSDLGPSSSCSSTETEGMGLLPDTDESDSDNGDILEDWDSFMHYTADDSDSDF